MSCQKFVDMDYRKNRLMDSSTSGAVPVHADQNIHDTKMQEQHVPCLKNELECNAELLGAPISEAKTLTSKAMKIPGVKHILMILLLLLVTLPLALLLAYSERLSARLGYNGCLPNGEFALPWTSSVWTTHILVITIPFTGPTWSNCKGSVDIEEGITFNEVDDSLLCGGYRFTAVKIIDLVSKLMGKTLP